jgi:deoxyribonuclease V
VAKKLLLGEIQPRQGNAARILDGLDCVGMALWLGKRKRPVYVSTGHKISLDTAVTVVEQTSIDGYPEPLRRAHSLSRETVQNLP